jgi:hypothetical protein
MLTLQGTSTAGRGYAGEGGNHYNNELKNKVEDKCNIIGTGWTLPACQHRCRGPHAHHMYVYSQLVLSACLPSCLPACLPACLPIGPVGLPACLSVGLPACRLVLPACLPACQLVLSACLPANWSCKPACLPIRPASLPACQFVLSPAQSSL